MREINAAELLCRDGRKVLEDERTRKGIAGFPGIEERFTSILEKADVIVCGSVSPQVRSTLRKGFLGGVSMMMSVLSELREGQPLCSDRDAILEGLVLELDLCYLEEEIETVRNLLRSDGDER